MIDVFDLKGRHRCTIRATEVRVIRFGDIPEDVWRGETFSSAEEFREVHVRCLPHLELHDGFEFVTLHFELVDVALETAHNTQEAGIRMAQPCGLQTVHCSAK